MLLIDLHVKDYLRKKGGKKEKGYLALLFPAAVADIRLKSFSSCLDQ